MSVPVPRNSDALCAPQTWPADRPEEHVETLTLRCLTCGAVSVRDVIDGEPEPCGWTDDGETRCGSVEVERAGIAYGDER